MKEGLLTEQIYAMLVNQSTFKVPTEYRVTDVAKCLRALYYLFKGIRPARPTGRALYVFDDGHMHHESVKKMLRRAGFVIQDEEKEFFNEERNLKGKIDGVILHDGKKYLLEIKSVSHFEFARLGWIDEKTYLQVQLYLWLTGLQEGVVIYKNKNTAHLKDFVVTYDSRKAEEGLKKFKALQEHLEGDVCPPVVLDLEAWECSYCGWGERCSADFGEVAKVKEAGGKTLVEDPSLEEKIAEYFELRELVLQSKRSLEDIKEELRKVLHAHNVYKVFTKNYVIQESTRSRQEIDKIRVPKEYFKKVTCTVLEVRRI